MLSSTFTEHPPTVMHGNASSHWCCGPGAEQTLVASNSPTCSPAAAPCASPSAQLVRQLSPLPAAATSSVAMMPLVLPAAAAGPTLCRTLSGGSSPGGSNWTTVTTKRRISKAVVCRDAPPPQQQELSRLRTEGDSVDLYYNQKEEFVRGWTRDHKQSRSFKSKKQTDFNVEKRRQQSMRDRCSNLGIEADEYDMGY